MPKPSENLSGIRFGRLLVKERNYEKKGVYWVCVCDCGKEHTTRAQSLREGRTKSCGCLQKEKAKLSKQTHGKSYSSVYITWDHMLQRCYNKNADGYSYYGGIGVTVCDRWNPAAGGSFENFYEDMGDRPANKSLNRVSGATVYSKTTCEWATKSLQSYDTHRRLDNKTGLAGVRYSKRRGHWYADIGFLNKVIYLGSFESFEEASKARLEAELKYYGFNKQQEAI